MQIIINVTRMQSVKDHTIYTALGQSWTDPISEIDIWLYGSGVHWNRSDVHPSL